METQTRTQLLLKIMLIVTWVAFIGFMIRAGTVMFLYGLSIYKPETVTNFYEGLNLYTIYQNSFWKYSVTVVLMACIPLMNSLIALQVIKILSQFKIKSPFTMEVALRLQKVSALAFGVWILLVLMNTYNLVTFGGVELASLPKPHSGDYVLIMAVLLFIISQVFKRGVELQADNDLTV